MSDQFPVDRHQGAYQSDQRQVMDLSPSNKLVVERIDQTAVITFDNPKAHTLDMDVFKGLTTIIDRLNQHTPTLHLIITGRGSHYFSAGSDFTTLANADLNAAKALAIACQDSLKALYEYRGVTIAAINGYAMGSGLECALACDIRVCESHSVMAMPELSIGLLPCGGATSRLTQQIGSGFAKRMLLCGEHIKADQALNIGLVEEVVESGQAFEQALKLAKRANLQSPDSIALTKALINHASMHTFTDQLTLERSHLLTLLGSPEHKEGISAFFEKRTPVWTNES